MNPASTTRSGSASPTGSGAGSTSTSGDNASASRPSRRARHHPTPVSATIPSVQPRGSARREAVHPAEGGVVTVIEERLAELGIELPPAPQPVASYIPVKVVGDLAWVAAQVPMQDGAVTVTGYAGTDVTTEEAGARRCAIQALAALRAALGTLDRVRRREGRCVRRLGVWVHRAADGRERCGERSAGRGLRRGGPACPRRGRRRSCRSGWPSRWGCWFSSAERGTFPKRSWLRARTGGRRTPR